MKLPVLLSVAGLAAAAPLSGRGIKATTPGFEVSGPGVGSDAKVEARLSKVTTPGFEVSGPGVGGNTIASRQDDIAAILKEQLDIQEGIIRNIKKRDPGFRLTTPGFEVSGPGVGGNTVASRQNDGQMLQTLSNFMRLTHDMGISATNSESAKRDDAETYSNRPFAGHAAHAVDKRQDPQTIQTITNLDKNFHDMQMAIEANGNAKRDDEETYANRPFAGHAAHAVDKRQDPQTIQAITNVLKNMHDTEMAVNANNGK